MKDERLTTETLHAFILPPSSFILLLRDGVTGNTLRFERRE